MYALPGVFAVVVRASYSALVCDSPGLIVDSHLRHGHHTHDI